MMRSRYRYRLAGPNNSFVRSDDDLPDLMYAAFGAQVRALPYSPATTFRPEEAMVFGCSTEASAYLADKGLDAHGFRVAKFVVGP